ncbi:MAG: PEP-CTERM sorting domain-containing protein [Verrucomicrobiota bacterium]
MHRPHLPAFACPTSPALRTAMLSSAILLSLPALSAADFYWGSDTTGDETAAATSWQDNTHWFEDAAGTIGAAGVPGANDRAIFSITSLNATALVPRAFADVTVGGMLFNNTTAFNLTGSGNRLLHIGSQGVTLNADAASVTFGTSAANRNILVRFVADQTWTNNSANTLRIRNSAAASDDAAGDVVLTLNAAGSGSITNSGAFSDGSAGSLALIIDSTGTGTVSTQSGTYSGGTTIKRGVLSSGGGNIGTGAIKLGDTTGDANATLQINTTAAVTTDMVVQAGNTGVSTLEFVANNSLGGTYDGTITLDNTLNVGVRNVAGGATFNGVISGAGDFVKGQYQGGNSGVLTFTAVNTLSGDLVINNGAFTLADDAALTFYIGADGVNNRVTGTSTGAVTFAGDFILDLSAAELVQDNSWLIVDIGSLNESFAGTFTVQGFTDNGDDTWTLGDFSFSELTGALTYTGTGVIPEPSTFALLAGLGALGATVGRRRPAL